jgi:hypothetical protein
MRHDGRQPDEFQHLAGAAAHRFVHRIVQPDRAEKTREHGLQCRQFPIHIKRPGRLDEAQVVTQLVQINLPKPPPQHLDLPRTRPEVPGDDARQCALAAPVGPENRHTPPGRDGPRDAVENRPLVADETDVGKPNGRLAVHGSA